MTIGDILSSPDKWTKGASALNRYNQSCRDESPWAVCWCLSGALWKLYPNSSQKPARDMLRTHLNNAASIRGYGSFIHFNDHPSTTYEDVMNLLAEIGQGPSPA